MGKLLGAVMVVIGVAGIVFGLAGHQAAIDATELQLASTIVIASVVLTTGGVLAIVVGWRSRRSSD